MVSRQHLAGYALAVRTSRKNIALPTSIVTCRAIQAFRRPRARKFLVVTHNCIQGSKSGIIHWGDLHDDHECLGAFHSLKIAKAFKEHYNYAQHVQLAFERAVASIEI